MESITTDSLPAGKVPQTAVIVHVNEADSHVPSYWISSQQTCPEQSKIHWGEGWGQAQDSPSCPAPAAQGAREGWHFQEDPVEAFIRLLMRHVREREVDKLRQVLKNAQY